MVDIAKIVLFILAYAFLFSLRRFCFAIKSRAGVDDVAQLAPEDL